MAKFKMAAASLCLLLALLQATQIHAVVNKGSVSSGPSKDGPSETDANDRISNSYGPPRLNDVYGPPDGSGPPRFHGPAPAYGPPPAAPVYGPPPPPPPRKPKPHYGPPKPQYGPPKPQYGPPKPQYGPPKQQYGPPIFEGPPPPPPGQKYGPPLKIRNQYGPPKNGHGPPIPISIETYGPPNKEPSLPFNSPQDNYGPPPPPPLIQHSHVQIRPVQQEYGAPLEIPSPPPGVPAPPTPPDIKYDGWQPIAGLVGTPPDGGHSGYSLSSSSSSSLSSSSSYSSSHSSSSSLDISGGDGFHSEALVGARYPIGNVPSDSYGTPIHSAEAQDLKSSVQQSSSSAESHGLPPPALPTYEEHLNSDGYSGGIGISSHATSSQLDQYHQHLEQEQQQQLHQPLQQYGIPGLTNEPSVQYGSPDPEPISIIKTVAFELLPTNGGHQESSGSSFGSSSSSDSFSINGGGISLPPPPPPSDSYGLPHGSAGGNSLGTDFQSLSIGGSSGFSSDSSSSSHGLLSGGDLVLPPPPPSSHHPTDSYSAPPPSSYSPNGPYPASQGIRNSGSFQSSSSFGSNFHKQHSSGHHRHVHRPHGPPFRHGPPPPPPGAFIPPRNRPPVKFRNQIPPGVISALRQYDIPPQSGSGKPFKAYGAPSIHGGSSGGRQQQTLSSSSHQFSSGGGFFGSGSFGSNSAFAAPNVNYGTPLSFTEFNTPAPVLTYGAPNFGADANSFISNSGSFGSGLYSSLGGNALTTTYGTPIVQHQPHHDCSAGLQKTNQVSFGASSSEASSSGFSNNFASFGNSYDAGNSGANLNLNVGNFYDTPAVNVLTLQNHQQPNVDLKDSYGNPIGVTYGTPDQTVAALTSNDIHVSSGSSSTSSSASSLSSSSNFNNQFQVNSISYPSGNYLNDAVSAEALTAALTAQGFGEAKHSESIGVDASRYLQTHEGSEALALAQGLTATGSDGFQIQGSKGIYSLQIQPADGGLGTENSDGSIRHEQVLSNGLLQDILAAIEQPQNGRVEIQGSPQIQNLEEIYGDLAHAASGNVYNGQQREQNHDINLLENLVQQTLNNAEGKSANVATASEEHNEEKTDIASEDSDGSASGKDEVALFFNNNYEESKKEGRSLETSESESPKADASE